MDTSTVGLIAAGSALLGVVCTQLSGYFLESKKAKHAENLKSLDLRHQSYLELLKQRRSAYVDYLVDFDHFINDEIEGKELMRSYYHSLILATPSTSAHIIGTYKVAVESAADDEVLGGCKAELYKSMRTELESEI